MPSNGASKLALCIPSYKRPRMLGNCLAAVGNLTVPAILRMDIVVVDNDAAGSAMAICDAFAANSPFPLHYFIEPERGLACVRNRLFIEAISLGADWLACLDDDEMPIPQWLELLYAAVQEHGADIAFGAMRQIRHWELPQEYAAPTKGKIGGTSTARVAAAWQWPAPAHRKAREKPKMRGTGNVLISARLPRELDLRFDPQFNFSGAEDIDYFIQAYECGCAAVCVDEALVFEMVTAQRISTRGLFYRNYTVGIDYVLMFRKRASTLRVFVHFSLRIVGKICSVLPPLLFGLFHQRHSSWQKAAIRVASALGYVAGLLGIKDFRYRNPDGE